MCFIYSDSEIFSADDNSDYCGLFILWIAAHLSHLKFFTFLFSFIDPFNGRQKQTRTLSLIDHSLRKVVFLIFECQFGSKRIFKWKRNAGTTLRLRQENQTFVLLPKLHEFKGNSAILFDRSAQPKHRPASRLRPDFFENRRPLAAFPTPAEPGNV